MTESGETEEPGKVGVVGFVLTQHSCLGLCFNKEGPPPAQAGCCCVDLSDLLDWRHRLLVFLFAFMLNSLLSISLALPRHPSSSPSPSPSESGEPLLHPELVGVITFFVVLPLTCMLKGRIAKLSAQFKEREPYPVITAYGIRLEEALLVLLVIGLTGFIASKSSTAELEDAVVLSMIVYAIAFAGEIVSLIFKYFFCRICCPCCVPSKAEFNEGLAEDLIAGVYGAGKV